MPYSAGTAYLQVVPSFRDVQRGLEGMAEEIGRRVDGAVEQGFGNGTRNGIRNAQRDIDRAGNDGGQRYGTAFERSWRRHLRDGYRNLPEVELDANSRPIDRAMHRIREQMKELSERDIDVDFDEREAIRSLRAIGAEIDRLERGAGTRRDVMNLRAARAEVEALSKILRDARRRGAIAGGEYGEAAERAVRRAVGQIPRVRLDLDDNEFNRRLDRVRGGLASIAAQRIGVDIDDAQFRAQLESAERELEELARQAPTVQLKSDVARARATLREFLQREIPGMADDSGERAGGSFARSFNQRIRAALNHTPDITPNTNISPSMRRLQQIRREIEQLDNDNIDLNVDAAQAMARVRALHAELELLTRTNPDINVRVDAARAAAELAALIREAQYLDGLNLDINVRTDADRAGAAMRRLGNDVDIPIHRLGVLIALGFAIGPAIVPAAAAASVALAGLATAAGAAVLGVGVLALGLSGVFPAVKALGKAQEDADKTAKSLAQAQTAIANGLDGVRSAERGLANTRASVESARRRAAKAVEDAEDGVREAVDDRRRAEEALVEAIKAAQRADEDRRLSIRGVALDLRQANLDVAEAKAELDKVMADPKASDAERERATIAYEQRVLQIDELTLRQRRLAEEQAKWNREGVKGSSEYKAAQERVKDSTDGVTRAQDRLAEAIEAQQDQQRQGQHQLEQASQAVVQAQRSLQQAYENAGTAGGEAFRNVQTEMAKLSPAGQAFAKFLFGLKDQFLALRFAAQEGMFPGFTRGIQELLTYLPGVTKFVGEFGRAIGESFEWAIKQMSHPQWREFFAHMRQSAIPAFQGLIQFTEKVSRAIATLIVTLSPFNRSMGQGLLDWAEGFATWADKLGESSGFQKFLAYVRVAGPDVLHLLGEMFEFVKRFVLAAAPVGSVIVAAFTNLFEALNAIPLDVLSKLVALIAGFSALMVINKAVMVLWRTTAGTMRATANGLLFPLRAYQRAFVGINGQLPLATRAQMAFNSALGRTAIAISPVYLGVARLYTVLRGPVVATATRAWVALGTAWATASGAVAALPGRLAAMYTVMRSGVVSVAAAAQRIYNTALLDARILYAVATTQVSRYYTSLRAMPAVMVTLATAQRLYNTALTDARILYAISATAVSRYYTAVRSMPVVTALSATAQRIYNTALTDGRILYALGAAAAGRYFGVLRAFPVVGTSLATVQRAYNAALSTTGALWAATTATASRFAAAVGLSGGASTVASRATGLFAVALTAVAAAAGPAAAAVGRFAAMAGTATASAVAGTTRALSGLLAALGGPWGLAIAAATLGLLYFTMAAAEQRAKNEALRDSLVELSEAFRATDGSSEESVRSLIAQNDALRDLILSAERYGLTIEDIVKATEGDAAARDKVLAAYDAEEQRLQRLLSAHKDASGFFFDNEEKKRKVLEQAGVKDADDLIDKIKRIQDERKAIAASTQESLDQAKANDIVRASNIQQAQSWETLKFALVEGNASAKAYRESLDALGAMSGTAGEKAATLALISQRVAESNALAADKADLFKSVLDQLGSSASTEGQVFDALSTTFFNIASSSVSAKDKIDLLRQAMEQMYGATQQQVDADFELQFSKADLAKQLASNTAGFDLEKAAAQGNTDAVRGNINALRDALKALQEKYIQDIANGMSVEEATRQYNINKQAVLDSIPPAQRNTTAVKDLNTAYGQIPTKKATEVTTPGIDKAVEQLVIAHAVQIGLAQKPPWTKDQIGAEVDYLTKMLNGKAGTIAMFKAEGGLVEGFSPHKRADNLPAMLTANEYVHPVDAVSYYGVDVMEAMRRRQIPRQMFDHYADGGLVGGFRRFGNGQRFTVNIEPTVHMPKTVDQLWREWEDANRSWQASQSMGGSDFGAGPGFLPWPSGPGASRGDSGVWRSIVALIRSTGPVSGSFGNAYRHGDPLWHGSGRAVDWMGFNQDALAAFLAARRPLELIHRTNQRDYAYTRGRDRGSFNNQLMQDHRNHIHIAMDRGGWLQTGWNPPVWNGTGQPEAVLTPTQSTALVSIARQGEIGSAGPRVVNQFEFRDTRLDAGKLQAINRAEAAYARAGRSR